MIGRVIVRKRIFKVCFCPFLPFGDLNLVQDAVNVESIQDYGKGMAEGTKEGSLAGSVG